MFNYIRNHKVLSAILAIDLIVVLVVVLIIVMHHSKTATIDVLVVPSEATVRLNGKEYENLTSYEVTPGDYHAEISMEGMETKEFDFELQEGGFQRVWAYLLDNEGGFSYYLTHTDQVASLREVADDEKSKEFLARYDRLSAINDVLPLTFSNTYDENATEIVSISIDWGDEEGCTAQDFCLVISDYTGKNHEKALSMIREAGFNPDDYEIRFKEGLD